MGPSVSPVKSLQAHFSNRKSKHLKFLPQAYLLWSRGRQFHDAYGVVGPAAFLIELNVTCQSINTDL